MVADSFKVLKCLCEYNTRRSVALLFTKSLNMIVLCLQCEIINCIFKIMKLMFLCIGQMLVCESTECTVEKLKVNLIYFLKFCNTYIRKLVIFFFCCGHSSHNIFCMVADSFKVGNYMEKFTDIFRHITGNFL